MVGLANRVARYAVTSTVGRGARPAPADGAAVGPDPKERPISLRYFYDSEFIEDGVIIDLVSIGVVCEDGREYYAVSSEFNPDKAGPWVRRNVLPKLPPPSVPAVAHPPRRSATTCTNS